MTAALPGTPADERAIHQMICETKGCPWEGQRWDALSRNPNSGKLTDEAKRCPECRQTGRHTGVKVYVADGEKHLERHGRIVDATTAGGELP